jgi:hypothetical protein
MSKKNKHRIEPLKEGASKQDKKNLDIEDMGPAPKPIKPITATATTEGIKEFVDRFNQQDDNPLQSGQ